MKKSNVITLLSLCGLMVCVLLYMLLWQTPSRDSAADAPSASASGSRVESYVSSHTNVSHADSSLGESLPAKPQSAPSKVPAASKAATDSEETSLYDGPQASLNDALFIGDSRTVGLMEYGGIQNADFFCTVGMSVYNIDDKPVSVPNVGKVTLRELLRSKKYDKVYIMLGINEVGYRFDQTVAKYRDLLERIRDSQPDAFLFIQANLHVTQKRSQDDKVVNNRAINGLNTELSKLADGKAVFYMDANVLFDDESGGLSADKSEDDTHLYAKYYKQWGQWIIRQTALQLGEG